jgi:NAD(P)-dependent dehydrogenase (short-subunit alcohol dehydrogenase family)
MSDEMSTLVVLITGALTGIGRAAALAFAKGGSRVVIPGCHEEAGQALAMVLHALGVEAEFLPFSDPRLSIREPPFRTIKSDMLGTLAHFQGFGRVHLTSNQEGSPR